MAVMPPLRVQAISNGVSPGRIVTSV